MNSKVVSIIMLSLYIFVIGCENMQKPAMDVIGDILTPVEESTIQVPHPIETTSAEIPKITFENVQDLQPGRYRVRPTGYLTHLQLGSQVIYAIKWGNVDPRGSLVYRADLPAEAPKISLLFHINRKPYEFTVDSFCSVRSLYRIHVNQDVNHLHNVNTTYR